MAVNINIDSQVSQTITDGVTDKAPSENAVFDALALKVDKVTGKQLSTEDYTTTEKSKLAGIASGAEVNVNADWNATSGDAQILNKPTISSSITIGTTLITSGVAGRVLFEGSGNVVQEDAGLFWDNVNKRLGVGTSTPSALLQINGTNQGFIFSDFVGGATNFAMYPKVTPSATNHLIRSEATNLFLNAPLSSGGIFFTLANGLYGRFFGVTGNLMLQTGGTFTDSGAKLHITAQGALSTDIAFRIRNSADTLDIIRANGAGEVFVGLGAGRISTGVQNTFIGAEAGYNNTTATSNVANGYQALYPTNPCT